MPENRNQFINILEKNKKKPKTKTEDVYLYDPATLFLRVILGESIDSSGINSLPAGGDFCKDAL